MAGDWALTLANLFGGEYATRMLNYVWLLVIVSFVYRALRRRLDHGPAALITGIFAATPLLQLTSTSMFIENFWTAMILGALFAIEQGEFVLAAALAGASGASKVLGFTPVPPLAVYAMWKLEEFGRGMALEACVRSRRNLHRDRRRSVRSCLCNHRATPSSTTPTHFSNRPSCEPTRAFVDRHAILRVCIGTPSTTSPSKPIWFVESESGHSRISMAPLVPSLCAIVFMRIKRTRQSEAALATSLFMVILVFSRQASLRYVECAMPLLVIAFAPAATALAEDRWFRWPACAAGIVIIALNGFAAGLSSSSYHRGFSLIPFSSADRTEYPTQMAPVRQLIGQNESNCTRSSRCRLGRRRNRRITRPHA